MAHAGFMHYGNLIYLLWCGLKTNLGCFIRWWWWESRFEVICLFSADFMTHTFSVFSWKNYILSETLLTCKRMGWEDLLYINPGCWSCCSWLLLTLSLLSLLSFSSFLLPQTSSWNITEYWCDNCTFNLSSHKWVWPKTAIKEFYFYRSVFQKNGPRYTL